LVKVGSSHSIPAIAAAGTGKGVEAVFEAELGKVNREQSDYDDITQHGVKQGTMF
jgi:hypothetical protein